MGFTFTFQTMDSNTECTFSIGFLPASTFPNPANLSCGNQYVSNFWTFASHPGTIFDPCPSLDDVQTLIMAGRAKLEASINEAEPLFKLPSSITYVGGTGGISTLGVDGVLPFSTVSSVRVLSVCLLANRLQTVSFEVGKAAKESPYPTGIQLHLHT